MIQPLGEDNTGNKRWKSFSEMYYLIKKVSIDIEAAAALMLLMLDLIKISAKNSKWKGLSAKFNYDKCFCILSDPLQTPLIYFLYWEPWHCISVSYKRNPRFSWGLTHNIWFDSHLLRLTCRATSSSTTLWNKWIKKVNFI